MAGIGCYILSRDNFRKVTEADPNGICHKPKFDSLQGICSDGKEGCFVIKTDGGLYQISIDFDIQKLSEGWGSIFGMCSDGANGCFIVSEAKRLWHVTPKFLEGVYWSSGWGTGWGRHGKLHMCPGREGCFVLNPATGNLWLVSQTNKVGKKWSDDWTSGLAKECSLCEDGSGGCFAFSGKGNLFHVTEENPAGDLWSGKWFLTLASGLGGMCWDGKDGCFIVSGSRKLWRVTPMEKGGGAAALSSNWKPKGHMASLIQSTSPPLTESGQLEIINGTTKQWLCKFYPADEKSRPSVGPPVKEITVSSGESVLLQGVPETTWLRFCDLEGNILQRGFVTSGMRVRIIDISSENLFTREGLKISPYTGYVLEVADGDLHDRVVASSPGVLNEATVLKAGGHADSRKIWLGVEQIGGSPFDYEGAFHWGVVVGEPDACAWEVTGGGKEGLPMIVVGPKGLVAHSPTLKEADYDSVNRAGRTLSLYGPAPPRWPDGKQDGTNIGGYILLPHKTTRTDDEIETWTKTWVKEHPVYSPMVQCQTYCHALYTFLVGYEFPYYDGKLDLAFLFTDARNLPHYQATFQWTCRGKAQP